MSKEFDELKKVIKNEDEAVDIQLDDTELEDSIKDDDEDHEESHMEKFSAMVRQSLAEEHEAAAQYTKRAAKCEKHGMEDAAKLFRDIAAEEVVHAGEFQALMEKYDILDQESIEQGEQEGKEILDGEKTEPEIDAPEIPADDTENESVNEEFIKQITQDEWDKTSSDMKLVKNGEKYMTYVDPESKKTVLGKVEIKKESRENPAVHIIKKGTGNMNYSAKSMKDAIAYVKQQNLDLENGDYFDIHTGMNTSEPDDLDFWGGTGAGYWRNVVNNPKTKDRVKQMVLDKEVKSIQDLHESTNEDYLNASPDQNYALKSLLPGEQHIPVKYYTERNIRNIYCSYLVQDMPDTSTMKDVDKINATYDEIRSKADNDPIDEILDFLNKTGDLEVHKRTENESTEKPENEENFLEKGDIQQRLMQIFDYTEEDYKAVELVKEIVRFLDIDQLQKFYEYIQEEYDINYDEVFGTSNEDAQAGTVASAGEAPTVVAGKGVIEAKPTKMCEELKALKEMLEN
uniref:Dlp-2, four-helix bundle, metal transport.46A n=1 Tax=Siphoviridae sp. ctYh54 TaxID=2826379 RepID=A0A8S5MEU5_9CAUD|nr:MAG TPA: Dlp-2, four-helix bundle, metal transport.46A [Siphoviridae sp. ctYh54]